MKKYRKRKVRNPLQLSSPTLAQTLALTARDGFLPYQVLSGESGDAGRIFFPGGEWRRYGGIVLGRNWFAIQEGMFLPDGKWRRYGEIFSDWQEVPYRGNTFPVDGGSGDTEE